MLNPTRSNGKNDEGNLGPGDLELLKLVRLIWTQKYYPIYAKTLLKDRHLVDNVKRMLPNEEVVDERELTKSEEDKKEDIVKGMKKNKDDFKKRYGDEAEAVMYATATKLAKENNANIFKTGADNAMSLANNMTKLHSKIDSKLASPFSKTSAFKNYKATNQANKIAAMKQGVLMVDKTLAKILWTIENIKV